jgi:NadR type nicotinamide-nucleotide adenylyltransferase
LEAEHREESNVTFVTTRNDLPINLTDDATWSGEVAIIKSVLPPEPVDAVFSSEFYGDRLATYFPGAVHIMVDQPRERVPMSATKFRTNPITYWHNLAPATRAGLTTRICVLGSESTGTTTMARMLADYYRRRPGFEGTQVVPEYGRTYCERHIADGWDMDTYKWTPFDFNHIGNTQNAMEVGAGRTGSPILICDTDAVATLVWRRRYLGPNPLHHPLPDWALEKCPTKDVYLVTDHEGVPFEQDGTRDGEHIRAEMTGWFIETLTELGHSWVLLTGTLEERFSLARGESDSLLNETLGRLK